MYDIMPLAIHAVPVTLLPTISSSTASNTSSTTLRPTSVVTFTTASGNVIISGNVINTNLFGFDRTFFHFFQIFSL